MNSQIPLTTTHICDLLSPWFERRVLRTLPPHPEMHCRLTGTLMADKTRGGSTDLNKTSGVTETERSKTLSGVRRVLNILDRNYRRRGRIQFFCLASSQLKGIKLKKGSKFTSGAQQYRKSMSWFDTEVSLFKIFKILFKIVINLNSLRTFV